jgi:hypothetical protein
MGAPAGIRVTPDGVSGELMTSSFDENLKMPQFKILLWMLIVAATQQQVAKIKSAGINKRFICKFYSV